MVFKLSDKTFHIQTEESRTTVVKQSNPKDTFMVSWREQVGKQKIFQMK